MRIRIVSENYYEHIGDFPKPGVYYLEPAESGTNEQNRLFHLLLEIYHNAPEFPYCKSLKDNPDAIPTVEKLKDYVKINFGAGYDKFVFVVMEADKARIHECKYREDIPQEAVDSYGIIKSWAAYTKEERTRTIKALINEMLAVSVSDKRFESLLKEMNT